MLIPKFESWDAKETLAQWSIVGSIYIHQDEPARLKSVSSGQVALLWSLRAIVGPFSTDMLDEAVTWLDKGATQIVLQTSYEQLVAGVASDLPPSRVLLSLKLTDEQLIEPALIALLPSVSAGVFLTEANPSAVASFRKSVPDNYRVAIVDAPIDLLSSFHTQHIDLVAAPTIEPGLAFTQCLRSDRPDGLFTTVVTDTSGVALGLVYSSQESIIASVAEGRGIFYSRSRGGLWRKGDSSGHIQELKQLDMDCDSDAVRCIVLQHDRSSPTPDTGSFCHLMTRTCWGPSAGLQELQQTLQERLDSAPAGSYTKRLFDDRTLLRNKLVEEAQELAEAEEPKHVAEETADVLYFAMVRAIAAGVSIRDIELELNMRSRKLKRRPGNAKTYRIEAAASILGQSAQQ
ncbi:unnamed protein product [Aphanomyces euteiches]